VHHAGRHVSRLTCELQENPIGIDSRQPRFSWRLASDRQDIKQTAYQLLVATSRDSLDSDVADMWNSGRVDSDQSVFVEYGGKDLASNKRYFWKVRVWQNDDDEAPAYSQTATFETAMYDTADWTARWIAKSDTTDAQASVLFRKEFNLEGKVKQARLYVTGLGNYVFYVNGIKAGDAILTPGWTHYPARLQYQVYDITSLLESGNNALGAIMGNGWWSSGLGWRGAQRYSNDRHRLLAQMEIITDEGDKIMVCSDESWKWHPSPIERNSLYHGVRYDARKELHNWHKPDFDDRDWRSVESVTGDAAKLVSQQTAPIRATHTLEPLSISQLANGNYLFDFGQNIVGWAKLKVEGDAGTEVVMKFAELLHEDSTVAQENLRSARATDEYILRGGGVEEWEPLFTYHGFRYVEVAGLPAKPGKQTLTGIVFHSDSPWIGSFKSSNELINQIDHNIAWGQRGNIMSVPTDCPQRDERLGWMGDAQIFAPTALYNMDLTRFFAKWMRDITDGQDESGYVYDVNPPIVVSGPAKPGWGDAVVVVPWQAYLYTGDPRILQENYEGMKAWVEYMHSKAVDGKYIWKDPKRAWYGYGDWVAPVTSPRQPISVAYYFYSTKLLGNIARELNMEADAEKYAKRAAEIATVFHSTYYRPDSASYTGGTQTANLLPLAFGITPDSLRAQIAQKIASNVRTHDVHPTTGFLGTGYILPMLSEHGEHALAYQMINQTTYPSWGYMVKQGATTMWELWNSDTQPPDKMNSRNHFALGGIGEWYYGYLAGIRPMPEHPGYKKSIIAPQPVPGLEWVEASVDTHYGLLGNQWKMAEGKFVMNTEIPANTSALVQLPVANLSKAEISINGKKVLEKGQATGNALAQVSADSTLITFEMPSGKYEFEVRE
jgi:alpha-L-rhamnosidase